MTQPSSPFKDNNFEPHRIPSDEVETHITKKRKLETEDTEESLSRFKFIIENKRVKEKERRRHLSRSIDELRNIIPQTFQTEKPNQACIMALSVEYIRHLQQKILEAQQELADFQYSGRFLGPEDLANQPPQMRSQLSNLPQNDFRRPLADPRPLVVLPSTLPQSRTPFSNEFQPNGFSDCTQNAYPNPSFSSGYQQEVPAFSGNYFNPNHFGY